MANREESIEDKRVLYFFKWSFLRNLSVITIRAFNLCFSLSLIWKEMDPKRFYIKEGYHETRYVSAAGREHGLIVLRGRSCDCICSVLLSSALRSISHLLCSHPLFPSDQRKVVAMGANHSCQCGQRKMDVDLLVPTEIAYHWPSPPHGAFCGRDFSLIYCGVLCLLCFCSLEW